MAVQETTRRGMSRRELIRNAGIAGAAAWTAPIIIDSVSSRALAVAGSGSLPTGCSYAIIVFTYGGVTYGMKILLGSSSCSGGVSATPDDDMPAFACGTHSYTIPPSTHDVTLDGNASNITPYPGGTAACDALFTVNGSTITRDNAGVQILFAVSHHGPPGGGYAGTKYYPVCVNGDVGGSSVTVDCNG